MKTKQHKTNIANAKSSPDPDLRLQIEQRAYEIWEAGGSRHGEDIMHWLQAETEVLERRHQTQAGRPSASA
jgi:hypothetical protein